MQTPIETGSPAAAWHLTCQIAEWLAQQAVILAKFWQPLVLAVLLLALVGACRRWAGQAAQ